MEKDDIALRLESLAAELERVTDGLERAIKEKYDDILVSNTEAARHLGVTCNTVTRYLREGRLDRVAIGGSTGIRFSQVMEMRSQ